MHWGRGIIGKRMNLCNNFECSRCIVQAVVMKLHSFGLAPYHQCVTPTTGSLNSAAIQSYEDNKTMVRIPKICLESFCFFFSIHDLIGDLTENFQKCSVESPPSYESTFSRTL